jgi:hypothetical protein
MLGKGGLPTSCKPDDTEIKPSPKITRTVHGYHARRDLHEEHERPQGSLDRRLGRGAFRLQPIEARREQAGGARQGRRARQAGGARQATPAPAATAENIHCSGINECKGKGACGAADGSHSCAGKNECKGKGWIEVSAADCTAKGGTVVAKK